MGTDFSTAWVSSTADNLAQTPTSELLKQVVGFNRPDIFGTLVALRLLFLHPQASHVLHSCSDKREQLL